MLTWLEKYFGWKERKTDLRTETVAGTTTFLAMAYIMFVQPDILAVTGMDRTALITVTCVATALATFITGVAAKAPIAMAPGMGLNAFFAYTLVLGEGVPWPTALGIVFLSGLFFLILTVVGLRKKLVEAIPHSLISAMSVGIGVFIAFIGLVNLGVVVPNEATLVAAGPITETVAIGLAGFVAIIFLESRKTKGSLILGILIATLIALILKKIQFPGSITSTEFNLSAIAFKLDILGAFKPAFTGAIFTLMFMDMFDSIGTLVACCNEAKMIDERGKIKGLDRLLGLNAAATMGGAVLGTSTTTSFIESAAGIEAGGRSGFASVVTALWFLFGLLFIPLIAMIPPYATAPALIMVGFFMMKEVKRIDFANLEEGFPAFVIIIMIALSYSIATGLAFGFLSFVLFKLMKGKSREVKPVLWVIALLSLAHLLL